MVNSTLTLWAVFLLALVGIASSAQTFAYLRYQDPPRVERAVRPAYPAIAAAKRISGVVIVDVEIDPSGAVREATVRNGPTLLRQPARNAALRWMFNNAEPSASIRTAELVFTFRPVSYIPGENEADFNRPYQMSIRWLAIPLSQQSAKIYESSGNARSRTSSLKPEKQSLEAIGNVVAYDQLVSLTNMTAAPQEEVLLVRMAKRAKGQEASQYIKIVYTHGANQPSLPKEMFDGKSQWRFNLKREEKCDSSLAEMKTTKPLTSGGEVTIDRLKFTSRTEGLADEANLPCYALKPGDYRPQ